MITIKNKYKIVDDYVIIYLNRKNGDIFETYIDLEDIEKIKKIKYKWHAAWDKHMKSFYARATIYKGMDENNCSISNSLLLHRYIMDATKDEVVDHINHNTLDNRKNNLRLTTIDKNSMHREGVNKNNTTGYRNVSYIKSQGKYVVQLQVNGKNTQLGAFDDVHEAGEFAKKMREKYYGRFKGSD